MKNKNEIQPVTKENQPTPGYIALKERYEELEQRAAPYAELLDAIPEDIGLILDRYHKDFEATAKQAEERGETSPNLSAFLSTAEGIPEEYIEAFSSLEALLVEAESIDAELNNYAPEKTEEVAKKAAILEEAIDYHELTDEIFAGLNQEETYRKSVELLEDVSRVIAIRKLLNQPQAVPDFSHLELLEETLLQYEKEWQEHNLLRPSSSEAQAEPHAALPLKELFTNIRVKLNTAYRIFDRYEANRSGSRRRKIVLDATRTFDYMASSIKEGQDEPTIEDVVRENPFRVYNKQLVALLGERLAKEINELPANELEFDIQSEAYKELVEKARNIDADEVVKNMEVAGSFDSLPFAYGETELRSFLLKEIPPLALQAVKRVEFRTLTQGEAKEHNTAGIIKWSSDQSGFIIVISTDQVQEEYDYYKPRHGDTVARLDAMFSMERVIAHEFGHALHNELPIAILKQWDDKFADDGIHVTDYVARRYNNNHPHRYIEDFAESFAMYITSRGQLFDKSFQRLFFMKHILEKFKSPPSKPSQSAFDEYM